MSTYAQTLYQIVFSTYKRENTIDPIHSDKLFRYIWGLLKNKKCHLYRINGTENHIHIVLSIHQSISISSLVKDIKVSSNSFIKSEKIFPKFKGWQEGYGLFTYSWKDKDRLIEYVKNQQEHHRKKSFSEELVEILDEQGVEYDKKYLE
jgi:putative transposase